jgi:DNA-binding transcriptional MocR family regulator
LLLTTFTLDWTSPIAPEEQLLQQLIVLQEAGLLHHPEQLPTVRALAVQLHLSPAAVEAAYGAWRQRDLGRLLAPLLLEARRAGYSRGDIEKALAQLWEVCVD